jgi:hypothetical protein
VSQENVEVIRRAAEAFNQEPAVLMDAVALAIPRA